MDGFESLPERIRSKVRRDVECWRWVAGRSRKGYGQIWWRDGARLAHRVVFELLVGPIPEGRELDHFRMNPGPREARCFRDCVNPAHLEPVSSRENTLRGRTLSAANAAKTECPAGHPYEGENLHVDPDGHRNCRACWRERHARNRDAERERARERYARNIEASRERLRAWRARKRAERQLQTTP